MARDGQGYPRRRRDMMMMMIVIIINFSIINIFYKSFSLFLWLHWKISSLRLFLFIFSQLYEFTVYEIY